MTEYISRLQVVIKRLYGLDSAHVSTTPIVETFGGKIVWQGDVETFSIRGHPKAKRCFAWSYQDESGKEQFTAVLELPPVDSELSAVRAALIAQVKNERKET